MKGLLALGPVRTPVQGTVGSESEELMGYYNSIHGACNHPVLAKDIHYLEVRMTLAMMEMPRKGDLRPHVGWSSTPWKIVKGITMAQLGKDLHHGFYNKSTTFKYQQMVQVPAAEKHVRKIILMMLSEDEILFWSYCDAFGQCARPERNGKTVAEIWAENYDEDTKQPKRGSLLRKWLGDAAGLHYFNE